MSSLQVENLKANYGPITALKDVSIEVPQKSIVALLGANGAGKSTTLKCISGVVKPAGGKIQWDGTAITGQTPNAVTRKGIAQVPEGRRIFKDLSVTDNLEMGAYTRSDRGQIEKDLEDVPEDVREELDFVLVERIDQVFEAALCEPSPEWQEQIKEAARSNGKEAAAVREAGDGSEDKEETE